MFWLAASVRIVIRFPAVCLPSFVPTRSVVVLFRCALRRRTHHRPQRNWLDELHIDPMCECELHHFLFTVESKPNTNAFALVELLHDSPALVPYPAQRARIDQVRRKDFGKSLAKAARRLFPVL